MLSTPFKKVFVFVIIISSIILSLYGFYKLSQYFDTSNNQLNTQTTNTEDLKLKNSVYASKNIDAARDINTKSKLTVKDKPKNVDSDSSTDPEIEDINKRTEHGVKIRNKTSKTQGYNTVQTIEPTRNDDAENDRRVQTKNILKLRPKVHYREVETSKYVAEQTLEHMNKPDGLINHDAQAGHREKIQNSETTTSKYAAEQTIEPAHSFDKDRQTENIAKPPPKIQNSGFKAAGLQTEAILEPIHTGSRCEENHKQIEQKKSEENSYVDLAPIKVVKKDTTSAGQNVYCANTQQEQTKLVKHRSLGQITSKHKVTTEATDGQKNNFVNNETATVARKRDNRIEKLDAIQPRLNIEDISIQETNAADYVVKRLLTLFSEYEAKDIGALEYLLQNIDKEKAKLLRVLVGLFDREHVNKNKVQCLINVMNDENGLKFFYNKITDQNGRLIVNTAAKYYRILCILYQPEIDMIYAYNDNITVHEETNKTGDTIAKRKAFGLHCSGISNLCFMYTALQVIFNLESLQENIKQCVAYNSLAKAISTILESSSKQCGEQTLEIQKNDMLEFFKQLQLTAHQKLGVDCYFQPGEQDSAEILVNICFSITNERAQTLQGLLSTFKCQNTQDKYPYTTQIIDVNQYELRVNEKHTIYEAVEYYFQKEANSNLPLDKIYFTALPRIVYIYFTKQIFTDVHESIGKNKSLGAIFQPTLTFLHEGKTEVTYFFRAAVVYKPKIANNNEDIDSGHYTAIVLRKNRYYECNNESAFYLSAEEAQRRISLYGIAWFYER